PTRSARSAVRGSHGASAASRRTARRDSIRSVVDIAPHDGAPSPAVQRHGRRSTYVQVTTWTIGDLCPERLTSIQSRTSYVIFSSACFVASLASESVYPHPLRIALT